MLSSSLMEVVIDNIESLDTTCDTIPINKFKYSYWAEEPSSMYLYIDLSTFMTELLSREFLDEFFRLLYI